MSRNNWTDAEQSAICKAYVHMLECEYTGTRYNKSAIRRELLAGPLASRSNGSVEAKLMNVSAAAQALGFPLVPGYKPASNYQASLRVHLMEKMNRSIFHAGNIVEACKVIGA